MEETFRLLIIDDEVDFLDMLAKRLKKRGLSVDTAASGETAFRILALNQTDVVVLDVNMPEMDGFEVLKRIKEQWPLLEVIMLTAHASVDAGIEGIRLGAVDYCLKPVDFEDLLEKTRLAFRNVRRQRLAAGGL